MKNRFNRLTSKEWLPFQKSWFKYSNDEVLYRENIRFFCKAEVTDENALYFGNKFDLFNKITSESSIKASKIGEYSGEAQFLFFDLRNYINEFTTLNEYKSLKIQVLTHIKTNIEKLVDRRFICILIPNIQIKKQYFAYAWDLAKEVGKFISLKDEKIACFTEGSDKKIGKYFQPSIDYFYCLYFRKDEQSGIAVSNEKIDFFSMNKQIDKMSNFSRLIPGWFVLKPQPRKKDEILHPAKYPEDLVEIFVSTFTNENDNVFDPMSGTGSTQLGALRLKRNGFGTELSEFFAGIANGRCKEYLDPSQRVLFYEEKKQQFKIINKDARLINSSDFPTLDYMVTSPPYWDMLICKRGRKSS
jgi:DNA modification methylase